MLSQPLKYLYAETDTIPQGSELETVGKRQLRIGD